MLPYPNGDKEELKDEIQKNLERGTIKMQRRRSHDNYELVVQKGQNKDTIKEIAQLSKAD